MGVNLSEAEKYFMQGRGLMQAAKNDPNDPVSDNFGRALHEYFTSIAAGQVATAKVLDEMLDKITRLEAKLNK